MLYNQRIKQILNNIESTKVFGNQQEAAKEIVLSFTAHEHPDDEITARNKHVFLIAEMQSGKTGVTTETAALLKIEELKKYFNINSYYFVTGMNANGLFKQTVERIATHFDIDINKTNSIEDLLERLALINIYPLKNSDLIPNTKPENNSIIFIDESHFGSKEKDRLTKWIQSWKNNEFLEENNMYIVSVSATPFEELNSDIADVKQQIILKNDNSYIGISNYLENNQVIDADNTVEDILLRIEEAYERMPENKKGVCFIRTNKKEIKNNLSLKEKFNIIELDTSNNKSIDFEIIWDKFKHMMNPFEECDKKPIIFFIKEAMRAGQTLREEIKDYTYLIYDYTSNLPETTAQGLLGRICGYRKTEKWRKTLFYVNKFHVEQYDEWKLNGFPKLGVPKKKPKKDKKTWPVNKIGEISIKLSDDDIIDIERSDNRIWLANFLKVNRPEIQYDYLAEVSYISGKSRVIKADDGTIINDGSKTNEKTWDKFMKGLSSFRPEKLTEFKEKNPGRIDFSYNPETDKGIKFIHAGRDSKRNNNELIIIIGMTGEEKTNLPNLSRAIKSHLKT